MFPCQLCMNVYIVAHTRSRYVYSQRALVQCVCTMQYFMLLAVTIQSLQQFLHEILQPLSSLCIVVHAYVFADLND